MPCTGLGSTDLCGEVFKGLTPIGDLVVPWPDSNDFSFLMSWTPGSMSRVRFLLTDNITNTLIDNVFIDAADIQPIALGINLVLNRRYTIAYRQEDVYEADAWGHLDVPFFGTTQTFITDTAGAVLVDSSGILILDG